jgi:DNA polymerase/3'-5' exonuclease PolX
MELLAQLPGIGEKTAARYVDLVPPGVKTVASLRKALCALPTDAFARLPIATRMDLRYSPKHRVPRETITLIDREFHKYARGIKFDIGGSYRRGKSVSGDLDIVISRGRNAAEKPMAAWERFRSQVNRGSSLIHILDPFAGNQDKLTVYIRVPGMHVKADIFLAYPEEYIFALLFVTGSGKFNVRMRRVASMKGYLLNQRGLYRKADNNGSGILEPVKVKNEKEIFKILNMKYRTPSERVA